MNQVRVSSFNEDPSVVLGSFFNGFNVQPDSKFDVFQNRQNKESFILHGESDALDYDGSTLDDDENSYCVGVYDPVNKSVDIYKAPLCVSRVTSKEKRKLEGPSVQQLDVRQNVQRNALGQAFGTKKAKKAIADVERNRVDAGKLEHAEMDIVDNIKSATSSLDAGLKMEQLDVKHRPVPNFNADATRVEEIYPIQNIIPLKELQLIRLDALYGEVEPKKQLELLPYTHSSYISKHLEGISQETFKRNEKLLWLYYLSLLIGVYANRRCHNKLKLMESLNGVPEILLDYILTHFTIVKPGQFGRSKERGFLVDPHSESKLLCFILALMLHLDSFMLPVTPLAHELSLKPSRLADLLKTLGCSVKPASAAQADILGIPKAGIQNHKIASLKVPFKVPEMTRRKRKGGRS